MSGEATFNCRNSVVNISVTLDSRTQKVLKIYSGKGPKISYSS